MCGGRILRPAGRTPAGFEPATSGSKSNNPDLTVTGQSVRGRYMNAPRKAVERFCMLWGTHPSAKMLTRLTILNMLQKILGEILKLEKDADI